MRTQAWLICIAVIDGALWIGLLMSRCKSCLQRGFILLHRRP